MCDRSAGRIVAWLACVAFAAGTVGLQPAAAASTFTCTGFAPTTTSCSTGSRSRSTETISHDVAADVNYVGTIESSLAWGSKARVYRCTFTQALRQTCLGFGEFPPVGTTFTHRCRSIVPGTAFSASPELTLTGVEGGIGTWACSVTV